MSNSQQSEQRQPQTQPQSEQKSSQPNWLVVGIVLAIVGGIVQVLVNHYDGIAAFIVGLFSQVHLPPLQGSPAFYVLNILSGIAIILSSVLVGILSLSNFERQRESLRKQMLRIESLKQTAEMSGQALEQTKQIAEHIQQLKEHIQQLTEHNQQLTEHNQQLEKLLAKQQRKKGSSTSE